jgi:hypothetical protein
MTAAEQTSDDELCLHVADGHKWSFIVAASTKRVLQIPGLKPADRLDLLEKLNGITDRYFTADLLASISPMCDMAAAILHEARTLDPPQDDTHCAASFKILATPTVFRHFVHLNPSIMAAIKHKAASQQDRPAVPQPAETPPPQPPFPMSAGRFAHTQRRMNGHNGVTQHRSHYPRDQISGIGGGLSDFAYDNERDGEAPT